MSSEELFSNINPTIKNGRLFIEQAFKQSKYAIVNSTDDIEQIRQDLHRVWSFQKPEILLTITGGDENFSLPYPIRTGFKNNLTKLAEFTRTCIITSGLNTGVSKLVGEAIANYHHNENVTLIGISSFSAIHFAKDLVRAFIIDLI